MALLQIAEPGEAPAPHAHRRAIGIDLGTTNSLVATVRSGMPVVLQDAKGRPLLPSIVCYAPDGVEVGHVAAGRASHAMRRTRSSPSSDSWDGASPILPTQGAFPIALSTHPAWSGSKRVRVSSHPVEVSAEILKSLRLRAEQSLGGEICRRGRHRACVFRRCAAPGHEGRGKTRGAQRTAAAERAHRRRHRVRPGQWLRGHLCDLRSWRRYLRPVDPAPVARRIRGARDRGRHGAWRRRLRSSRLLLAARNYRCRHRLGRVTRAC